MSKLYCMPPIPRMTKILALCCGAFVLLLFCCALAAVYTVRHKPELVLEPVQQAATAAGIRLCIGSLDAALFPLPSVTLRDVRGKGKGFDFFVAQASLRPSLWQLLHGRAALGSLSLTEPDLRYTLPQALAPQAQAATSPIIPDLATLVLPALPFDCTLTVQRGRLKLRLAEQRWEFDDLNAHLAARAPHGLQGFASAGMISFWQGEKSIAWVQQVRLDCHGEVLAMPQGAAGGISLAVFAPQQAQLPALNVNMALEQAPDAVLPRTISAHVQGQSPAPFSLRMLGSWAKKQLYIDEFALTLGQDSADMTGVITFTDQASPAFTGHVVVHKLSLPQWFGFARAFPAGLQHALDAISGTMDVRLDGQGLYASHLRASACGSNFVGGGGVADWGKPVISLDITAPNADLGRILPESLGKEVQAPRYGHEPLLPLSHNKSDSSTDIGYAIFLRTDHLRYGALQGKKVLFSVTPAPKSVALGADIQNLYGGSGNATILLDVDKAATGYAITASLNKVRLNEAGKALGLHNPLPAGNNDVSATLTASGDSLNDFLHSLRGSITTESAAGEIFMPAATAANKTVQYKPVAHSGLRLSLEPRDMSLNKTSLECSGLWNIRLQTEALRLGLKAEGGISIGTQGLRCSALNVDAHGTDIRVQALPHPVNIDVTGALTADTAARTYSINKAAVRAFGAHYDGDAACRITTDGITYTATGTLSSPALRGSLAQAGISLPKTHAATSYGKASIRATVSGTEKELTAQNIKANLDASHISGKVHWQAAGQNKPTSLSATLAADTINADAYLPPASPQAKKTDSAWNKAFFTEQALDLRLTVGNLRYKNITWRDLRLPLVVAKGSIKVEKMQALVYGGNAEGSLTASLQGSALQTRLSLAVQQADMLAATRDRVMSSDIAGKGTFSATVSGLLPSPALALSALDGIWKIALDQGYQQSRSPQGQPTGNKTHFSSVSASGTIDKGVVRTSNFLLVGPSLSMSGYGSFNLLTEIIAAHFTLKFPHAPDVPVEISGTLNKPETHIRADKVLINGIGKLGSGIFNIMGNMAGGALLLLQ